MMWPDYCTMIKQKKRKSKEKVKPP